MGCLSRQTSAVMRTARSIKLIGVALALSLISLSQAAIYTIQFRGLIDQISGASADDGSVELGTTITGQFQYQTGLTAAGSWSGNQYYNSIGLTSPFNLTIGNYHLNYPSSDPLQYYIHYGGFGINVSAYSPPPPGSNLASFYFGMSTFGGAGWTNSTALPNIPPRLEYFPDAEFDFTLSPYLDNSAPRTTGHGVFTYMEPVPEQGPVAVLGLGVFLMIRQRKGRVR